MKDIQDDLLIKVNDYKQLNVFRIESVENYQNSFEKIESPTDICVDLNNQIYICEQRKHCISVLDENYSLIKKIGNTIAKSLEPTGICSNRDDRIFVTNGLFNRVDIFSTEGQFKSCFGCFGSREEILSSLNGILVDLNDLVIVCDEGNTCLKVYNQSGEYIKSIRYKSKISKSYFKPKSITMNSKGDWCVSYMYSNEVIVLDQSDRSILELDFNDNFNTSLLEVCYDDFDRLLVVDSFNLLLECFELDGRRISSRNIVQKEIIDDHYGSGLCILRNQTILICNFFGNRLYSIKEPN